MYIYVYTHIYIYIYIRTYTCLYTHHASAKFNLVHNKFDNYASSVDAKVLIYTDIYAYIER
jgi:hypothetical protein